MPEATGCCKSTDLFFVSRSQIVSDLIIVMFLLVNMVKMMGMLLNLCTVRSTKTYIKGV